MTESQVADLRVYWIIVKGTWKKNLIGLGNEAGFGSLFVQLQAQTPNVAFILKHRLAASIMLRSGAVLPGLEKSMRFRTVPLTMIQ